jgi:hypothetical protein
METKVQKLKKWLCRWLCQCHELAADQSQGPTTRVTQHRDFALEVFSHEGYDIEMRHFPSGDVSISAFLKGQKCIEGLMKVGRDVEWTYLPEAESVPSYRIRLYLKQHALRRINKE